MMPSFWPFMACTAENGTSRVMLWGLCAMSGASTLLTLLFCGQVRVAVVWLTGRKGARMKRTMPRKPVMAAVSRAALRFQKAGAVRRFVVGVVCCAGAACVGSAGPVGVVCAAVVSAWRGM